MKKDTDKPSHESADDHEKNRDDEEITAKTQTPSFEVETAGSGEKDHAKKETIVSQKELDALALSAIESMEVTDTDESVQDPDQEVKIVRPKHRNQWWRRKKVFIPAGILLLLIVVLAVPTTRYFTLGWIWHKDVTVLVRDSQSGSSLKNATVSIGAVSAQTDDSGRALIKGISLGRHEIMIAKDNYAKISQSVVVDVFSVNDQSVPLVATGTIVSLKFIDKVSGKVVSDAEVTSGTTKLGKSSSDGKLDVVIPKNKQRLALTISAPSFNVATIEITDKTKQIELTPTGSLYFLSKQSGKLDVVKSNLDGTDRKIIVSGTGAEDDRGTSIIASQDWKYAVLMTKRVVNKPASLYVVTTADDKYAVLDDATVEFTPIGWSGHYFIYQSARSNESWRANSMQLKSYNAETGKTTTLDQNASDPASTQQNPLYEMLGSAYVIDSRIVYTKSWTMYGPMIFSTEGKQAIVGSVKPDGSDKKTIKSYAFATTSWISSRLYRPQQVYFQIGPQDAQQKSTFSELTEETYKENITPLADYATATYASYLLSPNGTSVVWSEERDGKQAIFVGDKNADGKQEIAKKSDYKPYGWLTDNWILLQKNDSELYITTKEQLKKGIEPLKVSDYHRSANSLSGYGYGG